MKISRNAALLLLGLLFAALLVGTQIPGAWRDEAFRVAHLPWEMNKVAHFSIFAAMAWLSHADPLRFSVARVLGLALLLACLTEGLQFYASSRDPSWTDVGIDMAGAAVGSALAHWAGRQAAP